MLKWKSSADITKCRTLDAIPLFWKGRTMKSSCTPVTESVLAVKIPERAS